MDAMTSMLVWWWCGCDGGGWWVVSGSYVDESRRKSGVLFWCGWRGVVRALVTQAGAGLGAGEVNC
jgi:hypothetical protein